MTLPSPESSYWNLSLKKHPGAFSRLNESIKHKALEMAQYFIENNLVSEMNMIHIAHELGFRPRTILRIVKKHLANEASPR